MLLQQTQIPHPPMRRQMLCLLCFRARVGGSSSDINISKRCIWEGIKCNEAGSITKISWVPFYSHFPGYTTYWVETNLRYINFTAFPILVHLNLSGMELKGRIPAQIGTLRKLTLLDLSNNVLSGALPSTLANLSQLPMLNVSHNYIRGIPAHIGSLEKLTHLYLSNNDLTGYLPSTLANLSQLTMLDISHNHISGGIPAHIANLEKLRKLELYKPPYRCPTKYTCQPF
ncbi:hypothetical protein L6164_002804 [Bauhinia variegata]|uniref:Uncharacterized protein n=1 Tax=Bauhinia variegata TaxID=167791 RepID=A0ACB9Q1Z3_BAUVA|nr:hypothetical protein L6164_002804 [Bauhinia variegata]